MRNTIIAGLVATIIMVGSSAHAEDAKAMFEAKCAKCHGSDGKGATKMGAKMGIKDLTDAKVQAAFTDDKAFKSLKEGLKDGDKTLMKPVEDTTDAQIKALIAYVRAFKK